MSGFSYYHQVVPRDWEQDALILTVNKAIVGVKAGKYMCAEMYCTDEDCDCRRAMIKVLDEDGNLHATLSYAWEDYSFYRGWFGRDDISIRNICGVTLYDFQPQGPAADHFCKMYQQTLDEQPELSELVKKHYFRFKQITDKQHRDKKQAVSNKVGRNEKCPCGSGKKYKKCCAAKPELILLD